jgi:hypothetical protein
MESTLIHPKWRGALKYAVREIRFLWTGANMFRGKGDGKANDWFCLHSAGTSGSHGGCDAFRQKFFSPGARGWGMVSTPRPKS